jgi:hypothetical protein
MRRLLSLLPVWQIDSTYTELLVDHKFLGSSKLEAPDLKPKPARKARKGKEKAGNLFSCPVSTSRPELVIQMSLSLPNVGGGHQRPKLIRTLQPRTLNQSRLPRNLISSRRNLRGENAWPRPQPNQRLRKDAHAREEYR